MTVGERGARTAMRNCQWFDQQLYRIAADLERCGFYGPCYMQRWAVHLVGRTVSSLEDLFAKMMDCGALATDHRARGAMARLGEVVEQTLWAAAWQSSCTGRGGGFVTGEQARSVCDLHNGIVELERVFFEILAERVSATSDLIKENEGG